LVDDRFQELAAGSEHLAVGAMTSTVAVRMRSRSLSPLVHLLLLLVPDVFFLLVAKLRSSSVL